MDRREYRFGEKIKKVREGQSVTLKKLAEEMQVSVSLLSQIENNRVSPSIDTLLCLADILDIDPEYLFRDFRKKRKVRIVRGEERNRLTLGSVQYELLTPTAPPDEDFALETLELTIEPGGEKGSDEYGHPGREMGIILSGQGELKYGTESYSLRKGDSLSFSSAVPHILINNGEEPLKAIWIITPPRLFS
ncbi:helix-turn-helix domain-containing protein [Oceanispirochaeta sp.]|jgi:transcriptional regulator with XRE-family HTH domain|uniref:helix-turn-helix domain-containing protein n=1 Tax=Oceanispirochaeta sp. TaxID=2035350 RepID=UPI00260891B9|nr:XRE family transcriptional regulator [Oceanispirochaeta sp.]MDA3957261.1 XRE family transcriptional regulator [Oceanispirochaeta sp.]